MHIDDATTRITSSDKPGKNSDKIRTSYCVTSLLPGDLTVYTSTNMYIFVFISIMT